VNQLGRIGWFARHETRLAWRDWLSLMTGGNRRRIRTVVLGFVVFALILHGMAWLMLCSSVNTDRTAGTNLPMTTVMLVLGWSLMLSQAMESVTRAFYARGDLELILTSPARASRLFAVRIGALTMSIVVLALVLAAPFLNILMFLGGARWSGGYLAAAALAMTAVAAAIALTIGLFRVIGPKRTRVASQIIAAVIGAGFAIFIQFVAVLSYGSMPSGTRMARELLSGLRPSACVAAGAASPPLIGDPWALASLVAFSVLALAVAIVLFAPRFGRYALAASSAPAGPARAGRSRRSRVSSPAEALRRKEWMLLLRDPWLLSQTLMQLLYLLPAGFILWRNFHGHGEVNLLAPILIVTAGQLGGGLAWLAVSGEDAADLIASAPVAAAQVRRAKVEAVLGGTAVVFMPFIAALSFVSASGAAAALVGVFVAAGSSTAIQYWFRTQAARSHFRRRQTSSRIATFAEALSSTLWAGTGALAASGTWYALGPAAVVLMILGGAWMISPARRATA
jgi:ABC-2 type transport system permease protein